MLIPKFAAGFKLAWRFGQGLKKRLHKEQKFQLKFFINNPSLLVKINLLKTIITYQKQNCHISFSKYPAACKFYLLLSGTKTKISNKQKHNIN